MTRFATTLTAFAVLAMTCTTASAATFTLDGIYDPANDMYTHQFSFDLILDDGTVTGLQTKLKVGIGANADGITGGPSDLFVYFEVPLELKDMTWGTGTHDGYAESSSDVLNGKIAMNQNTGSEKIEFMWDGEEVEVKLSQRGNPPGGKNVDIQPHSDAGTAIGHELSKDGDGAVLAARTSLDYIMNNFPNNTGELNLWGDSDNSAGAMISNSPELKDDINGDDTYETVDPAFAKWPFHQSWEVQIAGPFTPDDLPNLLTSDDFFGATFGDDPNFLLHASPIKRGDKRDIIPMCDDPADCPIEEIPPSIPTPGAGGMGLVMLAGLAARRRRNA